MTPPNENENSQTTQTTTPSQTPSPSDSTAPPEEFKPDPTKSEAENATAKQAWQKTQDDAKAKAEADRKAAETPEAKAAREAQEKKDAEKAATDKANDTKANPFKAEEIKLPEGFEVGAPTQTRFVELVNKHGIPRNVVAELVSLQADAMKAASEASSKLFADTNAAWQNETKADPDIGGDKLEGVLSGIAKMVDQADDPAKLREALDLTGAGNHPVIVKWLSKFSAQFNEPGSGPRGAPGGEGLSHADRIFGTKKG